MKRPLTFFILFAATFAKAQCNYRITSDFNQSSKQINVNGMFFRDIVNGLATYKPVKMSGVTAIYQSSFSVSGKDVNGQDYVSVTNYDSTDFVCGPVAINYASQNYSGFSNMIWSVNIATIDHHIQNWGTPGYQVPPGISQWPGNGDVSNGMMTKLAPYVDVNGNGTYDPENGDYPDILGDAALFLILNDQNSNQIPGTMPMNVELHCMFYEYATGDALNTTTFLNVKLFNRGTATYNDFKFNVFNDFDLGNFQDDLCGVDISRNMAYVYNGDNNDEQYFGRPGFGVNPPAMGMISLNHPLISSVFPGDSILPHATTSEFLNIINGKKPNGTDITNAGTPTVFQYSDTLSNGYNEVALNNIPSDRRVFSSISLGTLAPNSVKCMDFAWIYARKTTGTSLFKSVDSLMKVADFVQNFYNNTNYCTDGMLQTVVFQPVNFEIYPNPSNGEITCVSGKNLEMIEVWNMEGKWIKTVHTDEKQVNIDLSQLTAGVYLIKLSTADETKIMPFYKQ